MLRFYFSLQSAVTGEDKREACRRARARAPFERNLICPGEPGVSTDVLPRSLRRRLANAAVTPDLLAANGELASL